LENGELTEARLGTLESRARRACLTYWREEWDALLLMRVGKLRRERNQAWTASGVAVFFAGLLTLSNLRLGSLGRELGPESTAMRMSAEKLAVDQVRHTLTEVESMKLTADTNHNSIMIRRVVIELVSQISGRATDLICRVEGIKRS